MSSERFISVWLIGILLYLSSGTAAQEPKKTLPSDSTGSQERIYVFHMDGDTTYTTLAMPENGSPVVVKGKIKYLLVQNNPEGTDYRLLDHREICAIDTAGVHMRRGGLYVDLPKGKKKPSTDQLVRALMMSPLVRQGKGPMIWATNAGKGVVVGLETVLNEPKTYKGPVLGMVKVIDWDSGRFQLLPYIEVETSDGIVTISVDRLAGFSK